jgi:hypothetical protein
MFHFKKKVNKIFLILYCCSYTKIIVTTKCCNLLNIKFLWTFRLATQQFPLWSKTLVSQPRSVPPRDSDTNVFDHFPRFFVASLSREMKCSVAVMLRKCQSGNCCLRLLKKSIRFYPVFPKTSLS